MYILKTYVKTVMLFFIEIIADDLDWQRFESCKMFSIGLYFIALCISCSN